MTVAGITNDDRPVLEDREALRRIGNNTELMALMRRAFMEELPSRKDRLRVAVSELHRDGIRRCAHEIGGSSASIGAESLEAVARSIERMAGEASPEDIALAFRDLEKEVDKLSRIMPTVPELT